MGLAGTCLRLVRLSFGSYWLFFVLMQSLFLLRQAFPLIIHEFFNELTGDKTIGLTVWTLIALMAATGACRFVIWIRLVLASVDYSITVKSTIHCNLLDRLFASDTVGRLQVPVGDALSRFRGDTDSVHDVPTDMIMMVSSVISFGLAIFVMIQIDAALTLWIFTPITAVLLITMLARPKIGQLRRKARSSTGDVTGFIRESLVSIITIKSMSSEEQFSAKMEEIGEVRKKADVLDGLVTSSLGSLDRLIQNLAVGFILILTGRRIADGSFTVGDFALFTAYLITAGDLVFEVGRGLRKWMQAGISLQRLSELEQPRSIRTLVTKREGDPYANGGHYEPLSANDRFEKLEISEGCFLHPNSQNGVADVTFRVERGMVVAVTGEFGSGKSTLLKGMAGLLPMAQGSIRFNGKTVDDHADLNHTPRIGYIPENPRLFSETLRENILLGLPVDPAALDGAVRSAVLEKDVSSLENGLETFVGPRGVKLSGGQALRTAAARMFVRGAELNLIDDISSGLDVGTQELFWQRFFEERRTSIVVTHRRATLEQADHVLLIKSGRLVSQGTLQSLLSNNVEMKSLWADHDA